MNQRVWLVTGCSSGFGRELVKVITANNEKVIGTVRKADQLQPLESMAPGLVTGVVMDVSDDESIKRVGELVKDQFGRLDVLINNAGYSSMGFIEEIPDEEVRRQFEVHFFGSLRMIRLALPFMRNQRSGHILNVTSMAGLIGYPGVGMYCASKFAVEGLGESLAQEIRPLGIYVTNVEPGPFRTEVVSSSFFQEPAIPEYKSIIPSRATSARENQGNEIGDPTKAAQAMFDVTLLKNPPVHLPLGASAYERVGIRLKEFAEEIEAFRYLGEPTDFTEEELQNE